MHEESVFTGGILIIKLGKVKQEFHVHRELLRSRSPYFEHILTSRHVETASILLKDVDENIFCSFLSWLYAGRFPVLKEDEWLGLCRLWLLAERFQVLALQNQVVGIFSNRLSHREVAKIDLETLHFVYDNTGPDSKLRMLFVHVSVYYGNQDIFARMAEELPQVFHTDYEAQQAKKARMIAMRQTVDPGDLTAFILPEVTVQKGNASMETKVKTEPVKKNAHQPRCCCPVEERPAKRKRTKVE